MSIHTRYSDLNPQRHVNNAAMGVLLAEARSRIVHKNFERVGRDGNFVKLVGQFAVSYLDQVHYPEPFEMGVGVMDIDESTVRLGQALFQHGKCLSVAESILAGTRNGRAALLPEAVRAAWQELTLSAGLVPRQLA